MLDIPADALAAPDIGVASVYVAVGKEGRVMVRGGKRLAALVKKKGTARVGYQRLAELDHANILHQAVMDAFRWRSEK